jgi:hypothetical protein
LTENEVMTEAEWLECTDPRKMLEFLRGKASERKLRLFACACCRHIWDLLTDARSRTAIDVAEQFADGFANPQALLEASNSAWVVAKEMIASYWAASGVDPHADPNFMDGIYDHCLAAPAACAAAYTSMSDLGWVASICHYACQAKVQAASPGGAAATAESVASRDEAQRAEWTAQAALLRDLFDLHPFRPVTIAPSWLAWNDGTPVRLAKAIYESRAFDRLPILADALEEARCDNADILNHCRQPGPHVRGCWVIDLLLGKT